jgi:hypothetical protein
MTLRGTGVLMILLAAKQLDFRKLLESYMGDESLPEQLGLGKYLEPSREEETLPEP